MSIVNQILECSTENIANASNTWEGWMAFFQRCGVTIIDDDSGLETKEVVSYHRAVFGLMVCTVKQEVARIPVSDMMQAVVSASKPKPKMRDIRATVAMLAIMGAL